MIDVFDREFRRDLDSFLSEKLREVIFLGAKASEFWDQVEKSRGRIMLERFQASEITPQKIRKFVSAINEVNS